MSVNDALKAFALGVKAVAQTLLDSIEETTDKNEDAAIATTTASTTIFTPPPRMIMNKKVPSSFEAYDHDDDHNGNGNDDDNGNGNGNDNADGNDNGNGKGNDNDEPESDDQDPGAIFYSLTTDAQRFDATPKTSKTGSKTKPRRFLPEACNDAICVWRMCEVPDQKIKDIFLLHGNKIKTKNKTKNETVGSQQQQNANKTTN